MNDVEFSNQVLSKLQVERKRVLRTFSAGVEAMRRTLPRLHYKVDKKRKKARLFLDKQEIGDKVISVFRPSRSRRVSLPFFPPGSFYWTIPFNRMTIFSGNSHIPTLPRQGIGSFSSRTFVKCHQTG